MPNPPVELDYVPNCAPANEAQKMYLLNFMERNKKFSQGEYHCQMKKDDFKKQWEDLKTALNNFPGASEKSASKWQKVRARGINKDFTRP